MRHNMAATGGKRQFQNHIIIGVREEGPPEEVDFLQMSMAGQKTQKAKGVVNTVARRQILRAGKHLLPFGIKPD